MGKDYPDWGGNYNDEQFYPLFDQAELAARLGSPITYDRRGSLIWAYDFAHGLGSLVFSTVLGATYELQENIWERPPFSCKLLTGSNAGSQVTVKRRAAIPQPSTMGFQVALRVGADVDTIYIQAKHYTGSVRHTASLILDVAGSALKIIDNVAGTVTIDAALPDLESGSYFAHAKLVSDLSTNTYERCLLDQEEYDLSEYTLNAVADATSPRLEVLVTLNNDGATEAYIYIDSLVITAAEPPN